MGHKTTISDIARELKTNVSTVSRALNDHPAISAATKAAVKEIAERLNYRQNKLAASLRSGRSHTVGVIIPSAELHFFGSVVHAIEQEMNAHGYTVILYQSNESFEQERKGVETLLQLNVDGVIASIALNTTQYPHFEECHKRKTPLVFFDRIATMAGVPTVSINDYQGGFMATEHLIKQGYTRIAHITARQQVHIFSERLQGYLDALRKYKIPREDELIIYADISIESGSYCMEKLLAFPNPPDAVFTAEDFTAVGVLQKLKEKKIACPGDFGVIGFANETFSQYLTPSLSTVDQQTHLMGQSVSNLLLDMMANKNIKVDDENIILEPVIVMRDSTARA